MPTLPSVDFTVLLTNISRLARGGYGDLGIINQPLAAIAKREEWIYVLGGEEEPIKLDRFSPVLHLIQTIRDEAHRFALTFHRARRAKRFIPKKPRRARL